MNQFTFESKQKTTLLGFAVLGLVCLVLSFFMDSTEYHTRFWTNLLHNTVYFTGISFVALFVLAAFTTAYAGWFTLIKRVWEAYSLFLIVGLVLFLAIIAGLWGHMHHLYHWAMEGVADPNSANYDKIIAGKASFLNPLVYSLGTIVVLGLWYIFAVRMRSISVAEDREGDDSYRHHRSYKKWAAAFLPVGGFLSAAIIWQWVMSIDAHWYSTLYAWYSTASWFVGCISLTILTLIWLQSKGYMQQVTAEHFHDLGKYMFAFSIFWTYLWFSQYMLIWYSNNGEETVYFYHRQNNYPVLFWGNLLINFILPFLVLMRNDTKRKFGTLTFVSAALFFGHWWDFFYMIKPGALINVTHASHAGEGHHDGAGHAAAGHDAVGHEDVGHAAADVVGFVEGFSIPGLLELGIFLGFAAFFMYLALNQLSKAALVPENDPYLAESVHHHV